MWLDIRPNPDRPQQTRRSGGNRRHTSIDSSIERVGRRLLIDHADRQAGRGSSSGEREPNHATAIDEQICLVRRGHSASILSPSVVVQLIARR